MSKLYLKDLTCGKGTMIKGIVAFNFYSPPSLIPCQRRLILFARKTMWFPRKKIIWYPPPPEKNTWILPPPEKKIFRHRPPPQAISNEWSLPKIADIDIKINCFKVYMPRCNFMRLTKPIGDLSRDRATPLFFFFSGHVRPNCPLVVAPMQEKIAYLQILHHWLCRDISSAMKRNDKHTDDKHTV